MLIQVHADGSVESDDALIEKAEALVRGALEHREAHLTRVEVHLSDLNSAQKHGADDKRCVLEARPAGLRPIAVSHQAATLEQSIVGAAEKLNRSLDSVRGRLKDR